MIYIYSYATYASGGPEALQQMGYYLRSLGIDSRIVFLDIKEGVEPMNARYLEYGNDWVKPEDVVDSRKNIIIVPETACAELNYYPKSKKYIWWLSKGFATFRIPPRFARFKYRVRCLLNYKLRALDNWNTYYNMNKVTHLCGSKYAYEYLNNEVGFKDVRYCVEPISLDFLQDDVKDNKERRNVVLYNPSKPSETMMQLLERGKYEYKPLKGLTPQGLAEMYSTSKLYVDFGKFPGPERMPKEAVYYGAIILVGNRNAAINDFDVAIPQEFKVDDLTDIEAIEEKIGYMLQHYEELKPQFEPFRKKIQGLEENFKGYLREIFAKGENGTVL